MTSIPKTGDIPKGDVYVTAVIHELLAEERTDWTPEQYRVATIANVALQIAQERKLERLKTRLIITKEAAWDKIKANTSTVEEHRERLRRDRARYLLKTNVLPSLEAR